MLDAVARAVGNDPKLIVLFASLTTIIPALLVAWQSRGTRLENKTLTEEERFDKQQERLSEEQKRILQTLRDELSWTTIELKSSREGEQKWRDIAFRWNRYGNDLFQLFMTCRHSYLNERQIWEILARTANIDSKSIPGVTTMKRFPNPPPLDGTNGGFNLTEE